MCGPNQYKKTVQRGVECTCTVWGLEWNSRSKKSNFRWWYLLTSDPIIQQLFLRFDRGQWQPEIIHWYHMRCPLQVFTKKRISNFRKSLRYFRQNYLIGKKSWNLQFNFLWKHMWVNQLKVITLVMRSDIKLILDLSVINSDKILDFFFEEGNHLKFYICIQKQTNMEWIWNSNQSALCDNLYRQYTDVLFYLSIFDFNPETTVFKNNLLWP